MTESQGLDRKELDPATQFKQLYDQEYLSVYRSFAAWSWTRRRLKT
ncbi:MAG: hypothetical protein M3R21_09505 [Candidatus Dormibacteraeota bacterium]|nr:hypothetical protein [Candidatus Dormibacteraeota bacterium]